MRRASLIVPLAAGLLLGQVQSSRMEDEHKRLREPNKPASEEASRLTSEISGKIGQAAVAKAVPRAGNLIDSQLFAKMSRDKVPHAGLTTDWEFARRVHLDLTGRIPSPETLLAFVNDKSADKRDRLIDRLIASEPFVDRWAYWFGDLYRNCQNRIGWPARDHFDAWIRDSLRRNKPYNQFVTEMLTDDAPDTNWDPRHPASSYLARWHVLGEGPTSDMYEDTADEIIVNIGRHFLGVNFQCVSCHDGRNHLEKTNQYLTGVRRDQFWSMAAFFSKIKIEKIIYQDQFRLTNTGTPYNAKAPSAVRIIRAGGTIEPTFVLTGEKPDPSEDTRAEFARMLTSHPQFARTAVNYIWKEFFSVGIVDPVDDFDLARKDQATHPELLDALARDFAENGYSLKRLMRMMAQSTAYQLSSSFPGEWKDSYAPYFARKFVRRMSAEEIHDAIVTATNVPGNYRFHDSDKIARFITEMPSPEEVNGGAAYKNAKFFLHTFGSSNREQFDRQNVGSIIQAMLLFGGEFVTERIRGDQGTRVAELLAQESDDSKLIDQLFLWTVSRYPTKTERMTCAARLKEHRREGAEDIQWALVNKLDFVFNY